MSSFYPTTRRLYVCSCIQAISQTQSHGQYHNKSECFSPDVYPYIFYLFYLILLNFNFCFRLPMIGVQSPLLYSAKVGYWHSFFSHNCLAQSQYHLNSTTDTFSIIPVVSLELSWAWQPFVRCTYYQSLLDMYS